MTKLTPMEEALFQSWASAHRIEDHNDPKNIFDYRKIYKDTNGQIHPPGMINGMATAANSAVGESQDGGDQADPFMAQAEMHKANLDSKSKERSDALKKEMNEQNNKVKIHLKTMELQHKSAESEKDRAHKAQQEQIKVQQAHQQAEADRQAQLQQTQMGFQHEAHQAQLGHQQAIQQEQMGHSHAMEQAKVGQEHDLHSKVMQEQLARSRPQAQPQGAPQMQPQAQPQGQPVQKPSLGRELFNRGMRGI